MQKYHTLWTNFLNLIALLIILSGCASLTAEQRLRVDSLHDNTSETLGKVQGKIKNTPESILADSIATLDSILAYTEQIKNDPAIFNEEKIEEYSLKIHIINENINRIQDLTLKTDVSFPLGTYKSINLSRDARIRIDQLAATLILSITELGEQYPGYKLNLIIKTVGYTDEAMVLPDSHLAGKIAAELSSENIPQDRIERRKIFNQVLSRYRAGSLNEYIAEQISKDIAANKNFTIEPIIIGKGESLPNDSTVYQPRDPQRRICIISPFVEVVP